MKGQEISLLHGHLLSTLGSKLIYTTPLSGARRVISVSQARGVTFR